jgi:two-component system response regulator AtoC
VRELRNAIERALLLAPGDEIGVEHLPAAAPAAPASERERVLWALEACAGNQSRAARQLGISRKVLLARLDSWGVKRPRKGSR